LCAKSSSIIPAATLQALQWSLNIQCHRQTFIMSNELPMMPAKRNHDGDEKESDSRISQFIPMFEVFRNELDEHHDRRERIIKASRDITAASKKM
jgi:hypothetical protein